MARTEPAAGGLQFCVVQHAGPDIGYWAEVRYRLAPGRPWLYLDHLQADSPRLPDGSVTISYHQSHDVLELLTGSGRLRWTFAFDGTGTATLKRITVANGAVTRDLDLPP